MARPTLHLVPLALLAAACSPQSAVLVEGNYWAFLSTGTSFSLNTDVVDPDDWDDGWNIDCLRYDNEAERAARQLDPRLEVCRDGSREYQRTCRLESLKSTPSSGVDVDCEEWINQSSWHVVRESMEPWRGEAIITSENDFQVGFHHRLPGGEDIRFAFAVALDFQPTECEIDDAGNPVPVPIDGDWVANWTEDLHALGELDELPAGYEILEDYIGDPNAKLYYLNARSYQFNMTLNTDHTYWSIPYEWRAGFSAGKFAEELFHSRAPRFGQPELYDAFDLDGEPNTQTPAVDIWYCDADTHGLKAGDDPASNACMQNRIDHAHEVADRIADDFARLGVASEGIDTAANQAAGEPLYRPMVHGNLWRIPDGHPAGFDGWVELHYSYVVISGDIEAGEPVEGAFSILYEGDDSNSRFLVQGKFEVPKVKKDRWVAENVREAKHAENGTVRCSGVAVGYDD